MKANAAEPPSPGAGANLAAADDATARAQALVVAMTLDEKIGFVSSYLPLISPRSAELAMTPSAGFTPGLPRLGLPPLRLTDAGLGVANPRNCRLGDTATALPSALCTAAGFDPGLAAEGGRVVGAEARAKTFNVLLGGGVNLTRDPWAGRNFEYPGEDPLLAGRLAGESVSGIQSNRIASTLKHLALNCQETGRMVLDARIDPAALRESDLLAFEIALEIGNPASVMTAYNRVNGTFTSEHDELINGVLKGDWGFAGWVMSDWGAVHSTEAAALAGLDQESGSELDQVLNGAIFFTDRLKAAVEGGRVPVSRLDDMVERIVAAMIRVGAVDDPPPATPGPIKVEEGGRVAQLVAEAGAVLLRNRDALLPLRPLGRILVVGGHADVGVLSGGGSSQVRSVGGAPIEVALDAGDSAWFCRRTYHASSPLAALRRLAPEAQISFLSGEDVASAASEAKGADVVIVFATQWQTEATDALSLALPEGQDRLIAAIAAVNARTVVVLETGGPVLMPWLESVAAVLAAWYPGQRGGEAIARILFGEVNPSGRLPITFPASDDQPPRPRPVGLEQLRERDARIAAGEKHPPVPPFAVEYHEGANVGYRWYEVSGQTPLFPFGFGLSYTTFHYSDLQVEGGVGVCASVVVGNRGDRSGTDTIQIYVRATDSRGIPSWRLAGFSRVDLAPGECRRVTVDLEPRTFAVWDADSRAWRWNQDRYAVALGRSAADHVLHTELAADGAGLR